MYHDYIKSILYSINNIKRQNPVAQISASLSSGGGSNFSFAEKNAQKALSNPFKTFYNFNTQLDTYIDKVICYKSLKLPNGRIIRLGRI